MGAVAITYELKRSKTIMQWQAWVFSGVGVALPIALLTWFVFGRRGNRAEVRQEQRSGDHSTNIQIGRADIRSKGESSKS